MQKARVATACVLLALAIGIAAQQRGGTAKVYVGNLDPASNVTFKVPDSDLSVIYPSDFRVEDAARIGTRSYRAVYGTAEERGAGHCFPVLIELGIGVPELGLQDPKSDHFVPDPPTGGLVLQQITPACLDPKSTLDDRLANLVAGPRFIEGYSPLASIVSYKMDRANTYFSAVTGYSKDKDGVRRPSAGQTFIADVAMEYQGKIFLWIMTSNDFAIFNRLLGIYVRFGDDKPWPLVPFKAQTDDGKGNKTAVPKR